jgi:superfamily II DNA/RNA helicase
LTETTTAPADPTDDPPQQTALEPPALQAVTSPHADVHAATVPPAPHPDVIAPEQAVAETKAPADQASPIQPLLPADPAGEPLLEAAGFPPLAAGDDEPPPVEPPPVEPVRLTFTDLGLSAPVLRAIDDMGYRYPTPIQEQAIPYVLMTRDVLGVAQTGTGKTAGFTLPMIDILAGSRARARMPRSLILEPTRELALQVAENFQQYGKYLKLTHALIIGGESMSDQKDALMRGVDVLIATPGRLIDMFERGSILLTDTRILVIDEADRMLDMGFIPDVERIVALLPRTRQTLFFSATMGPEIKRLADAFLQNPKEVTVSRSATVATTITEGLALVAEHDKREALRRMVRNEKVQNALVFCNRKRDVDILYKSLSKHRFSAGALHGDMAQTVRFATLEKFKAGELQLLVCSDVAARGLDIGGLSHVFNFDVPHHAEDYVHRIGRTGRAGLEGHAFTIATPEDRVAVEAIEKLTGHPIPPMIVEGLDPVAWAEDDGRKRRGRGGAKKKAAPAPATRAKPERAKPAREKAPPAAQLLPAEDPVVEALPPRPRSPRREREEPRREAAPRRDDVRRDDVRREEVRRDDPRRERFRRDDDLGPAVMGFGDDVPAFMLLRARTPRPLQETETES